MSSASHYVLAVHRQNDTRISESGFDSAPVQTVFICTKSVQHFSELFVDNNCHNCLTY